MIEFKYSYIGDRAEILQNLKGKKVWEPGQKPYRIIDVGAAMYPWSAEVLDATLDFQKSGVENAINFIGNINGTEGWYDVIEYVARHGKFDYAICTHTLEDIAYPALAMQMLPEIAKAGLIAVPSYEREFMRFEGPWPGYQHHRWMFVPKGDRVVLVPKVPFVTFIQGIPEPPVERTELQIYWDGNLPFEILNDDFLGPNVECVKKMYLEILGGRL